MPLVHFISCMSALEALYINNFPKKRRKEIEMESFEGMQIYPEQYQRYLGVFYCFASDHWVSSKAHSLYSFEYIGIPTLTEPLS